MKVYLVAYGWYYEGVDFDTVKVFTKKKLADKYADEYLNTRYDVCDIKVSDL